MYSKLSFCALSGVVLLATITTSASGAPEPSLSLENTEFSTERAGPDYLRQISIVADNLPADAEKITPALELRGDLRSAGQGATFDEIAYLGKGGSKHFWRAEMSLTGFDEDGKFTIPLWMRLGDIVASVAEVTFTRKTKLSEFSWNVIGPPKDLVLMDQPYTDFMIQTGGQPAQGVAVIQSTLQSATTKARITKDAIEVCNDSEGKSCGGIDIGSKASRGLFLRVSEQPALGTYSGNVTIGIDNHRSTAPIELTVHASSVWAMIIGAVLIIVGLLIAMYINVFGRRSIERAQALIAAANLSERIEDNAAAVAQVRTNRNLRDLKAIEDKLAKWQEPLTEEQLDRNGVVPPKVPSPFGNTATWATTLKTLLENISSKIEIAEVIARKGVGGVLDLKWNESKRTDFEVTAKSFAQFVTSDLQSVAKAEELVRKENDRLEQIISPPPEGREAGLLRREQEVPIKVYIEKHRIQIEQTSWKIWWFWLLISLLTGLSLIILPNPGFGEFNDFLICLLWGLGIGIGGKTLENFLPSTAAKQMGITLPRLPT